MTPLAINPTTSPPPTILGHCRTTQVPIGGVIRPGIRILTQAAQGNDAARAIYERGCAEGSDFDTIEDQIRLAVPALKNPLRPANVPYFSVRRSDFPTPQLAELLLERYGEVREDGVRRLYRFPVIFAADDLQAVMPHTLQVWAAGKRRYWAEFDDTGERRCKTYAEVPRDAAGRVIRLFGGRKVIDRPDSGGRCDPERCPQYQDRQCNLDARLLFLVPGLPTINPIALPTRSFYSLDGIRRQLLHVAGMRGGRIAGWLLGEQTFWIGKVWKDVTRIDDSGEAVKGGAWLIELQAPIDIAGLLRSREPASVAAAAEAAVGVLEAGVAAAEVPTATTAAGSVASVDDRARVKQLRVEVAAALEQYGIDVESFKRFAAETWHSEEWGRSPELLTRASALLKQVGPPLVRLHMLLQGLNVPIERFALHAARRFGSEHWQLDPEVVARAVREVERHAQDPDALAALIETELDAA